MVELGLAIDLPPVGHCQVDKKCVDRPQRYWALARRELTMLGIKNGRQPQLDNTQFLVTFS